MAATLMYPSPINEEEGNDVIYNLVTLCTRPTKESHVPVQLLAEWGIPEFACIPYIVRTYLHNIVSRVVPASRRHSMYTHTAENKQTRNTRRVPESAFTPRFGR